MCHLDVSSDDASYYMFGERINMTAAEIILFSVCGLTYLSYLYFAIKKPGFALVSCPFVGAILEIIVAVAENPALIIFFAFFVPFTLTMIIMSPRPPHADTWYVTGAKWLLAFIVLGIFASILAVVNAFLGLLGFAVLGLFIWGSIAYAATSRFATAAYVFSTLGYCLRNNLPLPMALESAATAQSKSRSRIMMGIKNWLIQGYPLSKALRLGYPRCPGDALAMVITSERINQLPQALAAIEANMVAKANERRIIRPINFWYPLVVLYIMTMILLGVFKFVIPKMLEVIHEMAGGELPAVSRVVLSIADWICYEYGWVFGLVFFCAGPLISAYIIISRFRPRRPDRPYLASRTGDFIKWYLPIFHWFERNYSIVQVVETLRASLNAGCPVNEAIRNTLDLDVNFCFRKNLVKWHGMVESGQDVSGSAINCGMGSAIAWALDPDTNAGNTLEILETVESFYRNNYSYGVNLAKFILWPCVTVLLGVIVGFVVYAIFAPLVKVVTIYSSMVMPG